MYARLLPLVGAARFNVLFARAVLEGCVTGTVYVDDLEQPQVAYVLHPCGMSLVCGSACSEPFNGALTAYMLDHARNRLTPELAQAFPDAWHGVLATRLGAWLLHAGDPTRQGLDLKGVQKLGKERVIEWVRLNFEFDRAAFLSMPEPPLAAGLRLERAGKEVFSPWQGSVMPRFFWDGPEHFGLNAVAFAVFDGNRPLCVAFSAWIVDGFIEIGIETRPEARKRGLGLAACAALIRYGLSKGLVPTWSAHQENRASQVLALRLGFKETRRLPYYGLVVGGS